ncbi:hypothetical protein GOODEAATRI_026745 [Goodea atripinnis]|uniref:SERRATE/Ars2 N-terminal domain-containing protein n=1 Tax=Goodea atripinnis TaxID=208336 RepID=A0ABV0Q1G5_9TELE
MLLDRQEFLLNMEDSVDETEAVKRYNQYKLDFRRQQLQDFFLQHKDHEWFRSKYHPDDITARKAESLAALKTRQVVFMFLLDNNWLDNVSLDMEHESALIKLLDAAGRNSASCSQGRKRKRSLSADSGEGSVSDSDSSHSDGEKEEEEEDPDDGIYLRQTAGRSNPGSRLQDVFLFLSERRKERGKEREKEAPPKPRPLHLTTSLFIRSIPPEVSKEEVTAVRTRSPTGLDFEGCWFTSSSSWTAPHCAADPSPYGESGVKRSKTLMV